MNYNDVRKNENKGFSLVELIVVIAIMAVLTSVLAPSLLQYVERSRAQKDDSAMGEVTNAILLAMSDQNIYDEVLYYSCYNNYSCYIDPTHEQAAIDANKKIVTKTGDSSDTSGKKNEQFMFNDDCRLDDEIEYYFAGNMRGLTITFQPMRDANASTFVIGNAIVNKGVLKTETGVAYKNAKNEAVVSVASTNKISANNLTTGTKTAIYTNGTPNYASHGAVISTMKAGNNNNTYLYNRVRATVGDQIELTSQTYRNSEYTVFIRMGSTGGNAAQAQDAIVVYGQWNGTNLTASTT